MLSSLLNSISVYSFHYPLISFESFDRINTCPLASFSMSIGDLLVKLTRTQQLKHNCRGRRRTGWVYFCFLTEIICHEMIIYLFILMWNFRKNCICEESLTKMTLQISNHILQSTDCQSPKTFPLVSPDHRQFSPIPCSMKDSSLKQAESAFLQVRLCALYNLILWPVQQRTSPFRWIDGWMNSTKSRRVTISFVGNRSTRMLQYHIFSQCLGTVCCTHSINTIGISLYCLPCVLWTAIEFEIIFNVISYLHTETYYKWMCRSSPMWLYLEEG